MNDKVKQLQNVMECSETMLRDAELGHWDKVINIEGQRSTLLENLFSSYSQDNNIEGMDEKIKKIIEINSQLETIAQSARNNAGKDVSSMTKGRQAVSLYAKNSA